VAVCTPYNTKSNFNLYSFNTSSSCNKQWHSSCLSSYMVKVKNSWIVLTAINTRMLRQVRIYKFPCGISHSHSISSSAIFFLFQVIYIPLVLKLFLTLTTGFRADTKCFEFEVKFRIWFFLMATGACFHFLPHFQLVNLRWTPLWF